LLFPNTEFHILGFIDPYNHNYVSYDQIKEWQRDGIIKYLGESSDVRYFLEETDCLVFPSFYKEGISRILLEAASMSIPIITTDNVGCRDVVDHGINGYLCKPRSVRDLVVKISRFLKLSENERDLMGINGRKKIISEYDEFFIIEEYLKTLDKYLMTRRNSKVKTVSRQKLH